MGYARKALSGAGLVFGAYFLSAVFGYTVRLIFARNLSEAHYGLFYAVFSLIGLFALFKELGLNQMLAKFLPEYINKKEPKNIERAMCFTNLFQFVFSGIVAVGFIFFADALATSYFKSADAAGLIVLLAIVYWLLPFENVFRYAFQGFQNMFMFSLVGVIRMLSILITAVVLFTYQKGAIVPAIAYLVAQIIIPLVFLPIFRSNFKKVFDRPSRLFGTSVELIKGLKPKGMTWKLAHSYFSFGVPIMIGLLGYVILTYTDTLVLTYFRSLEEVGYYQVALPTANLLTYLPFALSAVLLPMTSELWQKKRVDTLKLGMESLYKYSIIIIIPISLIMVAFPEFILNVLFGARYVDGAIALRFLALANIIYAVGHVNSNFLAGIGKPIYDTIIVLIAALINFGLNLYMIPRYGIMGAALTTAVGFTFILVASSFFVKKFLDVTFPYLLWLKTAVGGVMFVGLLFWLQATLQLGAWPEFIVSVLAGSVVYLGWLLISKTIDWGDVVFLRRSMKKG